MKKFTFVILLLFSIVTTQASHVTGGGIEYTCIGPRQWKINLKIYRSCGGVPLCASSSCLQPMVARPNKKLNPAGCPASPNQINFSLNYVGVRDANHLEVSLRGPAAKNGCDNLGQVTPGPNTPSVEVYEFEGVLNMNIPSLNAANTCAYWDIYWELCCRNSGITNLLSPEGQSFRIGTTLHIFDRMSGPFLNSSPVINNDHALVVCSGQRVDFNLAAIDPDGDSLSYEIDSSRQQNGEAVVYQAPFGPAYPFPLDVNQAPHLSSMQPNGPFVVIDPVNGNLSFVPLNNGPTPIAGNIAIYIKQWRRTPQGPLLVGITQRDYQLYVVNCPSNIPIDLRSVPANPDGSFKTTYTIHVGDSLNVTLMALDSDFYPGVPRYDSTRILLVFKTDPNATFTRLDPAAREDYGIFRYKALQSQAKTTQAFTFVAVDNNLPMNSVSKQFIVKVVDSSYAITITKGHDNCFKYKIGYTNRVNIPHLKWTISNAANDYSLDPGKSSNHINDSLIWLSFASPGKYLVRLTITRDYPEGSTIDLYDTINVTIPSLPYDLDSAICNSTQVLLTLPEGNYVWRISGQTDTLSVNDSLYVSPANNTSYVYSGSVTDPLYPGCNISDTADITVLPAANISNISGDLSPVKNSVQTYFIGPNPFHTITWFANGGVILNSYQDSVIIQWNDTGIFSLTAIAYYNFCIDSATETIHVSPGVGLRKHELISKLNIYPNPADELLHISFDAAVKDVEIELLNSSLQCVRSVIPSKQHTTVSAVISVNDLSAGLYFVKITTDGQTSVHKVLVGGK